MSQTTQSKLTPLTIATHAVLLLLRLIGLLPLPVIWLLSWPLAQLLYWLVGSRRRITVRNISRCFPNLSASQASKLARCHFHQLCQNLFSAGIIYFGSRGRVRRLVSLHGTHHFDQALAQKKNIILLAPHFLGLDIAGVRLSLDYPGASMYQPIHNKTLDTIIHQARERYGAKLLPHNVPLRPLLRLVKKGIPFYYLPDQSPGEQEGIFAPFFDIQTLSYPTLGRIASLTKATVIPCGCYQRPKGQGFEIHFYPPLRDFPQNDAFADTKRMNQVVEEMIRDHPEQYMWIHRRFKVRPAGEEPFYQ